MALVVYKSEPCRYMDCDMRFSTEKDLIDHIILDHLELEPFDEDILLKRAIQIEQYNAGNNTRHQIETLPYLTDFTDSDLEELERETEELLKLNQEYTEMQIEKLCETPSNIKNHFEVPPSLINITIETEPKLEESERFNQIKKLCEAPNNNTWNHTEGPSIPFAKCVKRKSSSELEVSERKTQKVDVKALSKSEQAKNAKEIAKQFEHSKTPINILSYSDGLPSATNIMSNETLAILIGDYENVESRVRVVNLMTEANPTNPNELICSIPVNPGENNIVLIPNFLIDAGILRISDLKLTERPMEVAEVAPIPQKPVVKVEKKSSETENPTKLEKRKVQLLGGIAEIAVEWEKIKFGEISITKDMLTRSQQLNYFSSEFIMSEGKKGAEINKKACPQMTRPFECPVSGCEKNYKSGNGMRYHANTAHKGPSATSFPCATCGIKCKSSQGLTNHLRTHANAARKLQEKRKTTLVQYFRRSLSFREQEIRTKQHLLKRLESGASLIKSRGKSPAKLTYGLRDSIVIKVERSF